MADTHLSTSLEVKKKTVTSKDGTNIYYETYAPAQTSKPILFFVHGIGGDTDGWQYVMKLLWEEGYPTVAMDLRGHGYSDHPKHAHKHTLEHMEEDIQAVLDMEHIDKPILIGHSGGAVISAQFAAHFFEKLQGVVLISGSYCPPAWLASPSLRAIARVVISIGGFISPPPYKRWHSPYPLGKEHKEFEVFGLMRTMFYNSLRSYLYTGYALMNVDLGNELQKIAIPTLLIASEHDGIFPLSIQQDMHTKIPNSKLVVLQDTNHVSILNNPRGVTNAMLEFLYKTE